MAILHWKRAKDVEGSYRQHSYHNTVDMQIPITVSPEDFNRKLDEIRRALVAVLSKKRTTGIYGTDYVLKSVDLERGFILVQSSTYIGD
jgi:hypothetical protein